MTETTKIFLTFCIFKWLGTLVIRWFTQIFILHQLCAWWRVWCWGRKMNMTWSLQTWGDHSLMEKTNICIYIFRKILEEIRRYGWSHPGLGWPTRPSLLRLSFSIGHLAFQEVLWSLANRGSWAPYSASHKASYNIGGGSKVQAFVFGKAWVYFGLCVGKDREEEYGRQVAL